MNYSQFIHALQRAEIDLDRKALAHIAMEEPEMFAKIAGQAKEPVTIGDGVARPWPHGQTQALPWRGECVCVSLRPNQTCDAFVARCERASGTPKPS